MPDFPPPEPSCGTEEIFVLWPARALPARPAPVASDGEGCGRGRRGKPHRHCRAGDDGLEAPIRKFRASSIGGGTRAGAACDFRVSDRVCRTVQRRRSFGDAALAVSRLHDRLRDALARFDEIQVASDSDWATATVPTPARPLGRSAYRVAAGADEAADGTLTLSVRLYDANDGTILWTRQIESIQLDGGSLSAESRYHPSPVHDHRAALWNYLRPRTFPVRGGWRRSALSMPDRSIRILSHARSSAASRSRATASSE